MGTCRTTARLTVNSTGEGPSTRRRDLNDSSTIYYHKGPTQTIETYRVYSQPSTTITQVTEERQIYEVPSQQHSEITYSIHGTQPKYQPVSFLVSSNQETTQPTMTTTDEEDQSVITQYRTRYTQQPRNTNLLATVAKQPGPTPYYYRQESDTMQTESESLPIHSIHSTQTSSQPNFTKVI